MTARLRLLGGVAVEHGGGRQETLLLDRPVSLLVCLALRADRVSRAELALLYRPDASDDEALAYLRKLVFRARKFSWAAGLEVSKDWLRWDIATDVAGFLDAARARDWTTAAALYTGPLLGNAVVKGAPGLASWLELESGSVTAVWLQVAASESERLLDSGHPAEAAGLLQRALSTDPLREEHVKLLIRALSADGRRTEALQAFERFRMLLDEEVGGTPLESTLALADSVRSRTRHAPVSAGLPDALTPFIGRQQELDQLTELLKDPAERLISIVGLGGSGKTRLAVEAARSFQAASGAGTAFVTFARVTDETQVPAILVSALGLAWEDGDAAAAVLTGLKQREQLLVLDNFEEVLPAAAFLSRLLEEAPGIRLLVTSRSRLGTSSERLVELGGMSTPGADQLPSAEFDAVKLFLRRAVRSDPDFTATPAVWQAIADICRQLEGLPLAIELAASWTRLLSATELRRQLAGLSPLLNSDLQDLPERHRSVWSVFEHTWNSLGPAEQQVLIRLTVFRGGFTLAAAEQAAGADLTLLLRLLDRLLVRRQGADRFVMHELVRQYAISRADPDGLATARTAHSRYHCQLLKRIARDLKGRDVRAGLEAVDADVLNFETAWDTAVTAMDLTSLEAAREALDYWLYYRARFKMARTVFGRAVTTLRQRPGEPEARRLLGLLLAHLAEKEFIGGEFEAAAADAVEAVQLLAVLDSRKDEAHARLILANGLVRQSRFTEARVEYERVMEVAEAESDDYLLGAAHNGLANLLCYLEGEMLAAEEHYRASLQAHRRLGNLEGVSGALTNLGACRFDLHDHAAAEQFWLEAVELAVQVGFKDREAALLNNLGSLAESAGQLDSAEERYRRSLHLRRELGTRHGVAKVLNSFGRLLVRMGDPLRAVQLLREAEGIHLELGDRSGLSQSRSYLARALLQAGRLNEAEQQLGRSLEDAVEATFSDLLSALHTAAQLHEAGGSHDAAALVARTVASAAAGRIESLHAEATAMLERLSAPLRDGEALPAEELAANLLQQFQLDGNIISPRNN